MGGCNSIDDPCGSAGGIVTSPSPVEGLSSFSRDLQGVTLPDQQSTVAAEEMLYHKEK